MRLYGIIICILLAGACQKNDGGIAGGGDKRFDIKDRTGSSARALLSDEDYKHIVVELNHMPGMAPSADGLAAFKSFMQRRMHKNSFNFITNEIPSGGQSNYTINDIVDIEDDHRKLRASNDTVVVHILFADAEFDNSSVLGAAYWNTSIVIFQEVIQGLSGGIGEPSRAKLEQSVLNHEMAHLFGLVANGTPAQSDHHDEEHGAHCDVNSCLMFFAVETTDFVGNLFNNDAPSLDSQCIADLQANGGK